MVCDAVKRTCTQNSSPIVMSANTKKKELTMAPVVTAATKKRHKKGCTKI